MPQRTFASSPTSRTPSACRPALHGFPVFAVLSIMALLVGPAVAGDWIFSTGFESGSHCDWSFSVGSEESCSQPYFEGFNGADGSPWPPSWTVSGGVALADLDGGRARLRPFDSGYSLARMVAPFGAVNVEATFTMWLEDAATQGVGFYVRQNGAYLDHDDPPGEGYAVFVEGTFRDLPGIGVWKEDAGDEIPLAHASPFSPAADVAYRVRFRVEQADLANTRLRARMWPAAEPEPFAWDVDHLDSTPQLQGIGGGLAIDSWSVIQSPGPITASTLVDDLEVVPIFAPLPADAALDLVAGGFQFTEGPLWRGDHLLFSDITADTIYRLDPPANVTVFRAASGNANGLAETIAGDLLAAEHALRRISITDSEGMVTTFVDNYLGDAFNSPNDLAVRSDGTVYFTDPDYGLPGPRELPFNGLFRRAPGGELTAEWEGVPPNDQPNGLALSPDESTLYVSNTETGEILAWDVAVDGSLSNPRTFAAGLTIPDGLCVDQRGHVYVATWGEGLVVFSPSGAAVGILPVDSGQATNCAFGGDGRDLWVTAQTDLYRTRTFVPGT